MPASADEIAKLRDKLTLLAGQLAELERARELDRQLISCDIHDGLAQYVTGALMQLESIDRARVDDPQTRAALEKATALLQQSIADARRLVSGLRPSMLEDGGIAAAIARLIEDTCRVEGIEVEYAPQLAHERLKPNVEDTLYRIAQESLNNICRHSDTKRAQVTLEQEGDRVRLVVRDWGRGFDPAAVPAQRFGLEGIRKRAELVGGHADIQSAPGAGTTVTVELPYRRDD